MLTVELIIDSLIMWVQYSLRAVSKVLYKYIDMDMPGHCWTFLGMPGHWTPFQKCPGIGEPWLESSGKGDALILTCIKLVEIPN